MTAQAPARDSTAWLFVGQGAQRRRMGDRLVGRFPELWDTADRLLGFSVREACLTDDSGRLADTRHLQPVMFVLNAVAWSAQREQDPLPQVLAGHSLGELNALLAAGCFDFETGLRLVRRRGELMAAAGGGAMVAIVGLTPQRVTEVVTGSGLHDLEVSNFNSSRQVVISCPRSLVARATSIFEQAGASQCVPLNVSASFHSRAMAEAEAAFAEYLRDITVGEPKIPVLSNVTARPHDHADIAELLSRQISQPVRWQESMHYLIDHGVTRVVEIGPGRTLTGFWEAALTDRPPSSPAALVRPAPARPMPAAPSPAPARIPIASIRSPDQLGSADFRRTYHTRWAYASGSMFRAIASTALVARMARAGLLSFFGAGGLELPEIDLAITEIRNAAGADAAFGMNLLFDFHEPDREMATVDLYLRRDVRFVEAAAYPAVTDPLVRFRLHGAYRDERGCPQAVRHVIAKVSRPEVALAFARPAGADALARLVAAGQLTRAEAEIGGLLPVSGDICVEADSAGHTDAGVALALIPSIARLRDDVMREFCYQDPIRVGASGGLGSPEAVAAAFVLGADFVVTGSVNQCTPEAGTSAVVKDMLAGLDVQDTTYAPAGDMFEAGSRVQVVRKGTLFAARGNNLYQLYRRHGGLDEIDDTLRRTIEDTYFRRSFCEVWEHLRARYAATGRPELIGKLEADAKKKMSAVFRWYFHHSSQAAMIGDVAERVNFQIHCGPAMGAFNRVVSGTGLQDWRNRHVDAVAELLMTDAASILHRRS